MTVISLSKIYSIAFSFPFYISTVPLFKQLQLNTRFVNFVFSPPFKREEILSLVKAVWMTQPLRVSILKNPFGLSCNGWNMVRSVPVDDLSEKYGKFNQRESTRSLEATVGDNRRYGPMLQPVAFPHSKPFFLIEFLKLHFFNRSFTTPHSFVFLSRWHCEVGTKTRAHWCKVSDCTN